MKEVEHKQPAVPSLSPASWGRYRLAVNFPFSVVVLQLEINLPVCSVFVKGPPPQPP